MFMDTVSQNLDHLMKIKLLDAQSIYQDTISQSDDINTTIEHVLSLQFYILIVSDQFLLFKVHVHTNHCAAICAKDAKTFLPC